MPRLVLSGGNAFHFSNNADGLAEYLSRASAGNVGIITFAIVKPYGPMKNFQEVASSFKKFDVDARHVLHSGHIEGLNALFMLGGRPDTLIAELADADFLQPMYDKWLNGMVLGGDSAGAMVLFEEMMAHGARMSGETELTPALGFVRGAVAAVHWDTADDDWKGRFRAANESKGILAIDESTSLIWEDGKEQVIGLGKVQKFGPAEIKL